MEKDKIKQITKDTIETSIVSFAKRSLHKKATFQILDLIIPKERKIRSIVGGLETSLGTTLWEPLAKSLATNNGFSVIERDLEAPSNMPSILSNILQNVISERSNDISTYNAKSSREEIIRICQSFINNPISDYIKPPRGRGVDIWLIKDDVNYFFDTKTVKPNVGGFKNLMEQVLNWYAYYYSRFPKGNAQARIVFPYNPYDSDFWEKSMGKGKPLERDNEAWVADQFWSFCSGVPNTYNLILESFSEIRASKSIEKDLNKLLNRN